MEPATKLGGEATRGEKPQVDVNFYIASIMLVYLSMRDITQIFIKL